MTATRDDPAPPPSPTYRIAAGGALVLLVAATLVYWIFEPWTVVDAFYFSVITVTTVGYGDLSPTTVFTKLFTVLYVISGVAIAGAVLDERLKRHHTRLGQIAERSGHALHRLEVDVETGRERRGDDDDD